MYIAHNQYIERLYELYPVLKGFDVDTGEVAMFEETLRVLRKVLPDDLADEPLIVGTLLVKVLHNPEAAGIIILDVCRSFR